MRNTEKFANTEIKGLFIKPPKSVAVDLAIGFLLNISILYFFILFAGESSIAMIGIVWVIIIAWRGGTLAGILGSLTITFSIFLAHRIPPHTHIPMSYFFKGQIPAIFISFVQTFIGGILVGYISTLVHKLRREIILRKKEIKAREKVQAELEQKIAELNTFGHTVAHGLKNPLTVINMAITTLAGTPPDQGNGRTKKMVAYIQTNTINMMNIIESLLVFAGIRVIENKAFSTFSMAECVEEAIKRLDFNIEKNNVNIQMPEKWPTIYGYAPWVTEVLVNYIQNAIKYGGNPKKGIPPEIELGYDLPETLEIPKQKRVRFWVKDNGDGIPQEKMPALFREFSRLHTSEYEGHGLGLSIVKSVIAKLGGEVGVEQNSGRGSCFFFILPIVNIESQAKSFNN